MGPRIYYDVTDIWEYARFNATLSGIQRVSVQMLSHIVNTHGANSLRLIGWHPIRMRIIESDASYFSNPYKYNQDDFCRHFGLKQVTTTGLDLRSYLKKKYGRGWRRPLHYVRLSLTNALTGGRTFDNRNIGIRARRQLFGLSNDSVSFTPGDLVFVVGATWNLEDYLNALARERGQRGITICHFIHDLVPLLTPEHVVDNVPEQFGRWLKHLSENTDYFLTNSQATKDDLDAWLEENGKHVPTSILPLAHQFGNASRAENAASFDQDAPISDDKVQARVLNAAHLPYVLCVGTIESRKNVWVLANVWKRIYARLGESTPRLIFAGKQGWLKEDFDDFLKGTGSLYGYIRVVERPSDAELAYLYRRCLFSVFPSYKEGWGLPVGESLWFGRPVVCSRTSSMPEVGGSLADYVDPYSLESIEAALLKMITDVEYREARAAEIARAPLRNWSDVADDLWRELSLDLGTAERRKGEVSLNHAPRLRFQDAT